MANNPDLYGSFGAADYKPAQGEFSQGQHINASPDAFGASVGQATQKLGETEVDTGQRTVDLATKYQGLINETMATNAESELIMKNAKLKGEFMTTEGLESSAALPNYMNAINTNDQELRKNLPAGALRMYDTLATRQKANYISDAQTYAASQIRKANMDSHAMLINAAEMAPLDPDVANNPQRVGEALGTAGYAHGAMLDETAPGTKLDNTGNVIFDDTPEGQYQKELLQNKIENSHSVIWQNTFQTLAKQDPIKAADYFESQKDNMPASARVAIDASLTPQVVNKKAEGATGYTMIQAQQAHQQFLTNPSDTGSNSYNLGNVKTAEGAANGTNQFVRPVTPADGVVLAANNLRKNYTGLTIEQIGNKWAPSSENRTSDWVSNVSKASGLSAETVPDLNDPTQMAALLKGISVAEKSPADRVNFTDDIISQGVQTALNGGEPKTLPDAVPIKPYATNPDGSPVTQADYYAAHRDEILAAGERRAEQDYPGNPTYRNMIRERLNNQMSAAIQAQSANFRQDNMTVQKAITGGMSNGNPPTTYSELQAIPGVKEVLDRVWVQDPKYAEGIDTQIQKMANRATAANSPNAYQTINRVLMAPDMQHIANNRISSQDQLDKLMGRNDGTGINYKDYKDATPALDFSQDVKDALQQHMTSIKNANGNIDGQGEMRAVNWYNNVSKAYTANIDKGDSKISDQDFIESLDETLGPHMPSRQKQIRTWSQWWNGQSAGILNSSGPLKVTDAASYASVPSGTSYVDPNGVVRTKP